VLSLRPEEGLKEHLDQHYGAQWQGRRCLRYEPGSFTRLPNRYCRFRHAGVDAFALDSSTFNAPLADAGIGAASPEQGSPRIFAAGFTVPSVTSVAGCRKGSGVGGSSVSGRQHRRGGVAGGDDP